MCSTEAAGDRTCWRDRSPPEPPLPLLAGNRGLPAERVRRRGTSRTGSSSTIFVYSWLETSVGPQVERNELRFTTTDMDMTVPYVVEETLV